MRALLLLLCLLVTVAWAQSPQVCTITVNTEPAGASLSDQYGAYLGRSGQPVSVDLTKYGTQIELLARLDGYEEASFSLKIPELTPGARLPRSAVKLVPTASLGRFMKTTLVPALGLLGLGVAFGGVFLGRRMQVEREKRRRQEILSEVDMSDSLSARQLGPWRLLQRIGRGGMATVYRAVPEASMNEAEAVAVKVMRKDIALDPEFLERFRREARLTRELDHPNVVRLIDWGEEDGYAFMVMELIEGGNLRERLQDRAVPPADAWMALQPLCAGLTYAHARGVVHRDLKPENLMITSSGLVKITDFGLARARDLKKITVTGTVLGTPAYMAPEQIHGEDPAPAMDQYSVGVMAYELLTGRVPFSDTDPVRQIFRTLSDPPPPTEMSEEIDAVLLRMLSKRPGDRYPSVSAAAEELERVLGR